MLDRPNAPGSMRKRPTAEVGALVISLDFELHWGVRDTLAANGAYRRNLLGARQAIPHMLDLFAEFDIAATWATVGLLFATDRAELAHYAPQIRPAYLSAGLSPYQEAIGLGEADDPIHYAPSLIALIAQRPRQEIGTHTFSHYYCLEPGQTRAAFRADLESALAIARKHGIDIRSIVFPRNQVNPAYHDLLLELGITCYRGNEAAWMYRAAAHKHYLHPSLRAARLLDRYLNISGMHLTGWDTIIEPSGQCNIASSRFLAPYTQRWRALEPLRCRRITRAIQAAATSKQIFHLWWHPHNFGSHIKENMASLRVILECFARCRAAYDMRSLSMAEAAEAARTGFVMSEHASFNEGYREEITNKR